MDLAFFRRPLRCGLCVVLVVLFAAGRAEAKIPIPANADHTDPINLLPAVRAAHERFYNLDYDGALSRFEAVQKAHPDSAMAYGLRTDGADLSRAVPPGPAGHNVLRARQFSDVEAQCAGAGGDAAED